MAPSREVWRMRRPIDVSMAGPVWPPGISLTNWRPEHAPAVHSVIVEAYRSGGGSVGPYDEWLHAFVADAEFDPETCVLAWADGDGLAGVALCWSSGFLKDLCVAERWRGRGLGEALVRHALVVFGDRGSRHVDLKVEAHNPSGAPRLYERLGFAIVERLPGG